MAKVKGCINESCIAHAKKHHYKASDEFCSKCGQPLSFVCKSCYTPIEESQSLCVLCEAKKKDRNGKIIGTAKAACGAALCVAPVVVAKGKKVGTVAKKVIALIR